MATKFVFVTGGVVSSLGKGITAASLGRLLKARGYKVSMQKCDPYYNVDPGLLSPLQHGEAFITDDGVAADLDLGHYERFTDVNLRGEASVTTGKVHKSIVERELRGEYHGGTVQVIPHVTDEIKNRIRLAAAHSGSDVAIIEIGGVVGDMESAPFMEAIRQMKWELPEHDTCFIHVTLLPYLNAAGEMKTKPTQHSVKALRSIGIQPDVIVCRTEIPITTEAKDKIGLFCNVKTGNVVQNADAPTLYDVPLMMEEEGLGDIVCRELALEDRTPDLSDWKEMVECYKHPEGEVSIALVGKYVELHDAYLSVAEALTHAGIANRTSVKLAWINAEDVKDENAEKMLGGYQGIILPGGYGKRGAEGIISAAKFAREHQVPCLMIGYGMQLGVVEACRNLLNLKGANSTEVAHDCDPAVVRIPAERVTDVNDSRQAARMGGKDVVLTPGILRNVYGGVESVHERHGNRYEVEKSFVPMLENKGLLFTGIAAEGGYPEAFELEHHPFYVGVIYHPEFSSRPNKAHPLFIAFINAAKQ